MGDFGTSVIRTITPIVVGWIVLVGLKAGFNLDANDVAAAVYPVVAAAYYVIARALERRWPSFGWLLGSPRTPTYTG